MGYESLLIAVIASLFLILYINEDHKTGTKQHAPMFKIIYLILFFAFIAFSLEFNTNLISTSCSSTFPTTCTYSYSNTAVDLTPIIMVVVGIAVALIALSIYRGSGQALEESKKIFSSKEQ